MKTILTILALSFAVFSNSAHAITAWAYRVESSGPIHGGKLKIYQMAKTETTRQVRFRYKLETAIGFKDDWVPYTLPAKAFDAGFLAALPEGQAADLGKFEITKLGERSFSLRAPEGRIDFTTPSATSTPWSRVELHVSSIVIRANLVEVVNE